MTRNDRTGPSRRDFVRLGAGAVATTATATTASAQEGYDYDGWLSDVKNYEGATLDFRGQSEVTVDVGAGSDNIRFAPPAILVDPGTTVVWEWTGKGGGHNVVHQPSGDGEPAFETEIASEAGHTFEYTFEAEDVFKYYCAPHKPFGMKGVVAVGSTEDQIAQPDGGGNGGGDGGTGGQNGDGSGGHGDGGDGGSEDVPPGAKVGTDILALYGLAAVLAFLSPLGLVVLMYRNLQREDGVN